MERGRIVKALSGFFTRLYDREGQRERHASGRPRAAVPRLRPNPESCKERMSPLVGGLGPLFRPGAQGMVEEIEPRRNSFHPPGRQ